MTARLLANENFPAPSVAHLRERGHDVLAIAEVARSLSDVEVLALAVGEQRSVLAFWRPLIEVIDWAYDNVTSTLCSCLATHAVLQFRYGQKRRRLPDKRWGVYPHRITDRRHPLVRASTPASTSPTRVITRSIGNSSRRPGSPC